MEDYQQKSNNQSPETSSIPYEAPVLTKLGSVQELTGNPNKTGSLPDDANLRQG